MNDEMASVIGKGMHWLKHKTQFVTLFLLQDSPTSGTDNLEVSQKS